MGVHSSEIWILPWDPCVGRCDAKVWPKMWSHARVGFSFEYAGIGWPRTTKSGICLVQMLFHTIFFITLMVQVSGGLAQELQAVGELRDKDREIPKAKLWVSPCEELCANLIAAIQREPAMLEMRLEDALVMQESCAAELVSAAKYAVRDNPTQVSLILKTALKLAPQRTVAIRAAFAYQRPVVSQTVIHEEVRRAELPAGRMLQKTDIAQFTAELKRSSCPLEIRRALLPELRTEFEVRRAELPSGPRLQLKTKQGR